MKSIVCFDFDGVIHSYVSGWKGAGEIPDPPVEGIKEAIDQLTEAGFSVVVFSSRCKTTEGLVAMRDWMEKYNIVVDDIVTNKPPAFVTIDDRCICFDGNAKTLIDKVKNFKTWMSKTEEV